jgi:succinate dehydrogenase flavin-adding protein (antitoxin of CptAB toxin-antitoxin module)
MQDKIEDIILKELGTEGMTEEAKQEMLDDIAESIQNYFIAFCYQKLSAEDKDQLERLIDAGDEAAQDSFLTTKITNQSEVMQQAVDQAVKDIREFQTELDAELSDLAPTQPVAVPVATQQAPASAPQQVVQPTQAPVAQQVPVQPQQPSPPAAL